MQPFVANRLQPRRLVVIGNGDVLVGAHADPRALTWNVDAVRAVAPFFNANTTALITIDQPRDGLMSLQDRRAWAGYAHAWRIAFPGGKSFTYGSRAATLYFLSSEFMRSFELQPLANGHHDTAGPTLDEVLSHYGSLLPHLDDDPMSRQLHAEALDGDIFTRFAEVIVLEVSSPDQVLGKPVSYHIGVRTFLPSA